MDIFYPVKVLAEWIALHIFKLTPASLPARAVEFFVFESIKIFILLSVIIYIVALVRTFLQPEKVRSLLSRKSKYWGFILAGILGIFTPFCTCSAIPLFIGFVEAGVPLGITFTFLVASPMINEVALVMLLGLFGLKIALLYIASGLVIAIFSGMLISLMHPGRLLEKVAGNIQPGSMFMRLDFTWKDRFNYAKGYTRQILKCVWPYIILGIGVGAWIHGFVPTDFLGRYAGSSKWYAVPFATLIGIPLYSNAAGVIPLVSALTEKGMSLGTALSFMMAVTGLSLPEFLILRKVMKTRLIAIFAAVVGAGIIFTGYFFNFILR